MYLHVPTPSTMSCSQEEIRRGKACGEARGEAPSEACGEAHCEAHGEVHRETRDQLLLFLAEGETLRMCKGPSQRYGGRLEKMGRFLSVSPTRGCIENALVSYNNKPDLYTDVPNEAKTQFFETFRAQGRYAYRPPRPPPSQASRSTHALCPA